MLDSKIGGKVSPEKVKDALFHLQLCKLVTILSENRPEDGIILNLIESEVFQNLGEGMNSKQFLPKNPNIRNFKNLEDGNSGYGFLGTIGDKLYIAFKRTHVMADVFTSIQSAYHQKFQYTETFHGPEILSAGAGAMKSYLKIRKQHLVNFFDEDNEILENITEIHITGHSLGGMLANHCFTDLLLHCKTFYKNKKIICHSFGSPRVFKTKDANMVFSKIEESKNLEFYRWINCEDPITEIPLKNMNFLHCSPGIHVECDLSTQRVNCTFHGQDYVPDIYEVCCNLCCRCCKKTKIVVTDHFITTYWRNLSWYLNGQTNNENAISWLV